MCIYNIFSHDYSHNFICASFISCSEKLPLPLSMLYKELKHLALLGAFLKAKSSLMLKRSISSSFSKLNILLAIIPMFICFVIRV